MGSWHNKETQAAIQTHTENNFNELFLIVLWFNSYTYVIDPTVSITLGFLSVVRGFNATVVILLAWTREVSQFLKMSLSRTQKLQGGFVDYCCQKDVKNKPSKYFNLPLSTHTSHITYHHNYNDNSLHYLFPLVRTFFPFCTKKYNSLLFHTFLICVFPSTAFLCSNHFHLLK